MSSQEDNHSVYSESDFDYQLTGAAYGDGREGALDVEGLTEEEEEEDGYEGTSSGSRKIKSLVKKAKKSGETEGEARDRSRSPLRFEKRVTFEDEEKERDRRIAKDVAASLRQEMQALLERASSREAPSAEEIDKLKLEQRTNTLMAKASLLSTDGAKAQYLAFAKVKANSEDARRKIAMGDGLAAVEALDRLDKVVDLRLELIQRADKSPGGWGAATIFEQIAQESDANSPKMDRYWKAAVAQMEDKKDSRRSASRGRPERAGGTRGNYSFRSVCQAIFLYSQIFLCGLLAILLNRTCLLFQA